MRPQLEMFPQPQPSYHNTVPVKGPELIQREKTAKEQEATILGVFMNNPNVGFTRDEMYERLQQEGRTILLSSVGRALTNLCTKMFLHKTDDRRMGNSGATQSVYKLNKHG